MLQECEIANPVDRTKLPRNGGGEATVLARAVGRRIGGITAVGVDMPFDVGAGDRAGRIFAESEGREQMEVAIIGATAAREFWLGGWWARGSGRSKGRLFVRCIRRRRCCVWRRSWSAWLRCQGVSVDRRRSRGRAVFWPARLAYKIDPQAALWAD